MSSVDQNPERQLVDVALDEIFTDFTSGKDRNRPQLEATTKPRTHSEVFNNFF